MDDTTFARIREQADKALLGVPLGGWDNPIPVGIYGLTVREVRLGNIIAIATTALEGGCGQ